MTDNIDIWSEAAVEQNRRWLSAYLLALTGDRSAYEDLVQEVFLIALKKKDTFVKGANFGAWLRGIARNVGLRHCQARQRAPLLGDEVVLELLDQASSRNAEESLDPSVEERRTELLRQCLQQLAEPARRMLELKYADGLPHERIAKTLGRKLSAVTVAIFRAREAVRECLRRKQREAAPCL